MSAAFCCSNSRGEMAPESRAFFRSISCCPTETLTVGRGGSLPHPASDTDRTTAQAASFTAFIIAISSLARGGHRLDLLLERIEAPVARPLAGRVVLQREEEPARDRLEGHQHECPIDHPVVVRVRVVLGPFERVAAQVEEERKAQ